MAITPRGHDTNRALRRSAGRTWHAQHPAVLRVKAVVEREATHEVMATLKSTGAALGTVVDPPSQTEVPKDSKGARPGPLNCSNHADRTLDHCLWEIWTQESAKLHQVRTLKFLVWRNRGECFTQHTHERQSIAGARTHVVILPSDNVRSIAHAAWGGAQRSIGRPKHAS